MPPMVWNQDPNSVLNSFHSRNGVSDLSSLVMWAVWSAEGLCFLDDQDATLQVNYPTFVNGHHPDVIDIAHARWATGTSITALDLCAAALGRHYCGVNREPDLDLRRFSATNPNNSSRRRALPSALRAWNDTVQSDACYIELHSARNKFTHSWLNRNIHRLSSGHASRSQFTNVNTGQIHGARQLVIESRALACRHVNAFLATIDTV